MSSSRTLTEPVTVAAAAPARVHAVATVLRRRLPFTTGVLIAIIVAGIATGTLWDAASDRTWFGHVGYGLPALADGGWWTPVTGSFLALTPVFYLPVLLSFAVFAGGAEWRLGTGRTVVICGLGQLAGVLGAALTLLVFRDTGWSWAHSLAAHVDAGFSAGALACAAAVSATLRSPWRLRLRAGLWVYVGVSFLFLGGLADLEHLWAVAIALPLSRRLAGGRHVGPRGRVRAGRREWRLFAATGLALIAVAELVLWLFPADSPLGTTGGDDTGWGIAVNIAFVALLANGLRSGRRVAWWGAVTLAAINVFAGAVAVLGFAFGQESTAEKALTMTGAVLWAAELVLLVLTRWAFRAPLRRGFGVSAGIGGADAAVVRDLLGRHGGSTLSWMATWPDNAHFRSQDGQSVLAYRRHAGVAVGLGDPIGPAGSAAGAVRAFAVACEHAGVVPCLFSVTRPVADAAARLGWSRVQIAEDTLVDLEGLELRGRKWQNVRSALNRAAKEGMSYRHVVLADEPWGVRSQVRAICDEWVGDKGMPEMGFTLGGMEEALDPATRVGLAVDADGSVHGVTSWLPVHGPGGEVHGWTLDLMRRRGDGFRPAMEFLIGAGVLAFQAEGMRFVSLSGAPLARSGPDTEAAPVERLLEVLSRELEPVYGFRSLHSFKAKFNPRHEPMYLAYRDEGDLPRIGVALTRAYLPDTSLRTLVKLATTHA
ncbi:phosphatidylglycerol lysyltransferase domain-containing protein [Amycolatopsis sp. DG1A-15b]|uniref:bifunctional lysylphosphatidylglycerol flippase/synthetase MprF n=1 Tax=Amycolatopsis sp. DG1A-15b TaxID=3052846 RepID=UPI00255B4AF1|nr:phosphatidylglycerol lysyltransferase domain-containing protein [Amycolatopsis sp. DG1A-15b]WIX85926.1 phosphatidylglycerol lysyltransferase domain-containing protein [Amycolatopsis sp. DG1A-15b]